jgi:hypothetical protein
MGNGRGDASPLLTAKSGLLPAKDIPMRISVAPFAIPGKSDVALAIVLGLRQPAPIDSTASISEKVDFSAQAFTPEGDPRGKRLTQSVQFDLKPGTTPEFKYEVLSRIDLKPGKYHLRYAVTSKALGKSASIYDDIEIPDFSKSPLALSGIVLSTTPPLNSGPKNLLASVIPVVPTTQREFAGHHGSAFMQVYQNGRAPIAPVTMTVRVTDGHDRVVVTETSTLDAAAFGKTHTADYRYELPIARLAPGPYLVTFEVSEGGIVARRHVQIIVR